MNKVLIAGITAALLGAGGVAATQTILPVPGIAVSNRITPAKDARVLKFTLTPKASWQGPYTWTTSINSKDSVTTVDLDPQPVQPSSLGGLVAASVPDDTTRPMLLTSAEWDKMFGRTRYMVDTVFQAFPTCAVYRLTVKPKTVNGVAKKDSLTKKVSVCRAETLSEIAFRDSFPSNSFRIIVCGKFQYQPFDTTNIGPPWKDSLPILIGVDSVTMAVGHVAKFATIMKNRYTGAVILMGGNTDPLCEATRAQMQTERAG